MKGKAKDKGPLGIAFWHFPDSEFVIILLYFVVQLHKASLSNRQVKLSSWLVDELVGSPWVADASWKRPYQKPVA